MVKIFIYCLIDPVTGHVRYIGKTNNISKRYYAHLNDKRNNHRSLWIRKLARENKKPDIFILDETDEIQWQFWEQHYISLFKSFGYDLTNKSDGGEGALHTPETKEKMSLAKKGKPVPHLAEFNKTRTVFSKPNLGKKHSEETRRKISEGNKSKIVSEETRKKMSEVQKGRLRPGLSLGNHPQARKIAYIDRFGNILKEYSCMTEASNDLGVCTDQISFVCRNKKSSVKNLHFKYI